MNEEKNMPNASHTLAFATVPFQKFERTIPENEVLIAGTLFPELYMPYTYKIVNRS